ncbi:thioredoxin domain-containing protein [Streptomyces durbertensis]|uniref:Thioredoxin domain-containing protein n=1 Tax=Streptomyces durbertensis TaxID=2448886 RepID=A0ABR6EGC1_9ACTN|nr:thioredoxin domain-containing protein [Streptomyces durbertensis]MBB1244384.1 thioredoxin domain-containing protein [Streptomyces durbertensis]
MSDNNDRHGPEQRSARDRLKEERERQKRSDKRRRTLTAALAVVAVLAAAGTIGVLATTKGGGQDDSAGPAPAPITEGDARAPVTLDVYEDFRCPGCAGFEQTFGGTINELREAGKVKVRYHLVTVVDGHNGSSGSKNAANAAACAKDAGHFVAYHDLLFKHQQDTADGGFENKKNLVKLAKKVDGLDTPAFRDCVEQGTHDQWVDRTHEAFLKSGYQATPTLVMDGEDLSKDRNAQFTPEMLVNKVEEAAEKS